MREFIWRLIARIVCKPAVTQWLYERAARNLYTPITARNDPNEVYMWRGWIFNPYGKDAQGNATAPRFTWLPSIRMHHIRRPDDDGALHDHPWNARTIVLAGDYREERPVNNMGGAIYGFARHSGYTGRVLFEQYHRISEVSPGGVWTLWFTWKYRGTWGFLVNGRKVPWREHLGQ